MGTRQESETNRRPSTGLRWLLGGALGAVVLIAAACSSNSASSTTTTTKSATAATSRPATVTLAKVGSLGTVLVSATGNTLYRLTEDSGGKSACTGGCATIWPPLTVPAGTTPVAGTGLAGRQLATITRADGTIQVTYKGMPLYTYSGDKSAGQATGQNVAGVWFAVTPTSSASTAGAGSSSSPTGGGTTPTTKAAGSGGYGY
jgi:predicted lipoprotein with Yx(FWY)xxD motif